MYFLDSVMFRIYTLPSRTNRKTPQEGKLPIFCKKKGEDYEFFDPTQKIQEPDG
jgi:hypothetical protein